MIIVKCLFSDQKMKDFNHLVIYEQCSLSTQNHLDPSFQRPFFLALLLDHHTDRRIFLPVLKYFFEIAPNSVIQSESKL